MVYSALASNGSGRLAAVWKTITARNKVEKIDPKEIKVLMEGQNYYFLNQNEEMPTL